MIFITKEIKGKIVEVSQDLEQGISYLKIKWENPEDLPFYLADYQMYISFIVNENQEVTALGVTIDEKRSS